MRVAKQFAKQRKFESDNSGQENDDDHDPFNDNEFFIQNNKKVKFNYHSVNREMNMQVEIKAAPFKVFFP